MIDSPLFKEFKEDGTFVCNCEGQDVLVKVLDNYYIRVTVRIGDHRTDSHRVMIGGGILPDYRSKQMRYSAIHRGYVKGFAFAQLQKLWTFPLIRGSYEVRKQFAEHGGKLSDEGVD